jgi:hypothetical protein
MARTRSSKTADGKVHIADLPCAEWIALVRDAHAVYITELRARKLPALQEGDEALFLA